MNRLQKILGIGTSVLTLAAFSGCTGNESQPSNATSENISRPDVAQSDTLSQLEGLIIKVQPSQISYVGEMRNLGYDNVTANHEFEYVMLQDVEGMVHLLIYPYSKAILERNAIIKFKPLPFKKITANEFIDRFLDPTYSTDDDIAIEAEGIINKYDGIVYPYHHVTP